MGTRLLPVYCVLSAAHLLVFFAQSDPDYAALVYKGCARQSLTDPSGLTSQSLSSVTGSLVSQSTKVKFYKSGSGTGQNAVSGLFQCRSDLSNIDCYDCVSRLPVLIDKLCGRRIAARVQLRGCSMMYEVAGFAQISGMAMLYKSCSGGSGGMEFRRLRDAALSGASTAVVGGHGFYATNYQSVYVIAQCEGDLGSSDCGECVKNAAQKAQSECGNSVSAQIYLSRCYLSYRYYANGVAGDSPPSGQNTARTVAIIVGGTAAVGFLVIFVLFIRGVMKKHDGD